MATRVRVTIEYDLDLEHDARVTPEMLASELQDWIKGAIEVQDVVECEGSEAVTIAVVNSASV